jgi:hypothetical protein
VFEWLKKKKEKTVDEVLDQYSALLIKYPIEILDISMLPLPKSQMKLVLKGLYAKEKHTDFEKHFENWFLYLSKFQEGVGDKPIDAKLLDGVSKADIDANLATLERLSRWQRLQLAELDILSAEWKQFKEQLGSDRQVH